MDKIDKFDFKLGGTLTAGIMICGNEILRIVSSGINHAYPIAASCFAGGIILDKLFAESKYEKLFRLCGLENKDAKIPLVIKKTKKGKETSLIIHLPPGICQKHFEQKQQELEQSLNSKIEFGFNKNLIMKLVDNNLSTHYDYVFEECGKPLQVYCGESHRGKFYLDIEKCPHIIVAGETNSGKSSLLKNIVLSLILNSHRIELHLIDFQAVELGMFESCKKVKSYGETPREFKELMAEMAEENERRLKLFRSVKNKIYIENLRAWNEHFPNRYVPYKVVVIDEFARLAEKEFEPLLEQFRTRVSMDRKIGIHYMSSLQRPDVKCISGSIKANMPTRIAFKTVSQTDSEVILDQDGAEKIKNSGRFLIKYCGEITEVQALYVESKKVRSILKANDKYKSTEEVEIENQELAENQKHSCINPYIKR